MEAPAKITQHFIFHYFNYYFKTIHTHGRQSQKNPPSQSPRRTQTRQVRPRLPPTPQPPSQTQPPLHLPPPYTPPYLGYGGSPRPNWKNNQNTWYPADDEKTHFKRNRNQPKVAHRKSVQPGNVVILLAGKHKGRRVVVLKHLASGNLLVTGPYAVNGVPLKRVNAAYVINTSTRVSLEGVNANVDDSFFKKQRKFTKNELKNAS